MELTFLHHHHLTTIGSHPEPSRPSLHLHLQREKKGRWCHCKCRLDFEECGFGIRILQVLWLWLIILDPRRWWRCSCQTLYRQSHRLPKRNRNVNQVYLGCRCRCLPWWFIKTVVSSGRGFGPSQVGLGLFAVGKVWRGMDIGFLTGLEMIMVRGYWCYYYYYCWCYY